MNKILTFTGAQPLFLGDIDFAQGAVAQQGTCIARAMMGMASDTLNGILQGVFITQGVDMVSWTAGVIVFGGEILPVPAGSISASPSDNLYFSKVSVLSGERTFKDGETHQCWETRSATITNVSAGGTLISFFPRLINGSVTRKFNGILSIPSAYINAASLIIKNGIFYIDINLDVTPGLQSQAIGSVGFSGLSDDEMSLLAGTKYITTMYITALGIAVTQNVELDFVLAGSSIRLDVTLMALDFSSTGEAFIQGVVPAF